MATKKTNRPNKSAFIMSLPMDLPSAEVVSKAKAAGLAFDAKYVATIRSNARRKNGAGPTRKPGRPKGSRNKVAFKRGPGRPKGSTSSASLSSSSERSLKLMVIELGVARATALVEDVRRKLKTMVGSI